MDDNVSLGRQRLVLTSLNSSIAIGFLNLARVCSHSIIEYIASVHC